MRLKIIKLGNQLALSLPEKAVEALQLSEGSKAPMTVEEENKWILITAMEETVNLKKSTRNTSRCVASCST